MSEFNYRYDSTEGQKNWITSETSRLLDIIRNKKSKMGGCVRGSQIIDSIDEFLLELKSFSSESSKTCRDALAGNLSAKEEAEKILINARSELIKMNTTQFSEKFPKISKKNQINWWKRWHPIYWLLFLWSKIFTVLRWAWDLISNHRVISFIIFILGILVPYLFGDVINHYLVQQKESINNLFNILQ